MSHLVCNSSFSCFSCSYSAIVGPPKALQMNLFEHTNVLAFYKIQKSKNNMKHKYSIKDGAMRW